MIRRRLTLKRVDPWSVLKFGFVVNIALLLVGLLGFWILWVVVGRLGLVDQFCDTIGSIVLDLQECSLNGGNIFRTLLLLGGLGVVVQTGLMVFGAFLYNLIADLTGGLAFTYLDDTGEATASTARRSGESSAETGGRSTDRASTGVSAGAAGGPPDQSSTPREPTPDGPPPAPGAGATPGTGSPPATTAPGSRSAGGARSEPRRPQQGSSGSLWGDPTRSNDRT